MTRNKDRLYVALYARGGGSKMPGKEDTYHWAFLTGPKLEQGLYDGMRYHAKEIWTETGTKWSYSEDTTSGRPTRMQLVRIMIGKIEDKARMAEIFRKTPIRDGEEGWNCVYWVKEALEGLQADKKAIGTRVLDWQRVRDESMRYIEKKKDEHRFDGKGSYDQEKAATYDLIEGKETIA